MSEIRSMRGVATILVFVYAAVGGALVIISALEPNATEAVRLTFKDYIESMVVAIGGLSIGRGVLAHAKAVATKSSD